jgi:hypothetical protein
MGELAVLVYGQVGLFPVWECCDGWGRVWVSGFGWSGMCGGGGWWRLELRSGFSCSTYCIENTVSVTWISCGAPCVASCLLLVHFFLRRIPYTGKLKI